jgi:hypothetical protein
MHDNLAQELAQLGRLTVTQLRARYAALFGEATRAGNKTWLVKRIAWRLQALAEGDLSERARQRAHELANDADLRLSPRREGSLPLSLIPSRPTRKPAPKRDSRLPPPGTILHRSYKGEILQVKILRHGLEFEGKLYRSLSAVAKAITGSHCNGFLFFRLTSQGVAS